MCVMSWALDELFLLSARRRVYLFLCVRPCERSVVCAYRTVRLCQLYGLALAKKGPSPICPVRVSHKVQSLLIVLVPDGRFIEDESAGLIRFPVLFGAKVSSFLHTFPVMPSVTPNSSPNRKLHIRLAPSVANVL